MIPILYEKSETAFLTNGLGALTDCIKCNVTERLNDYYTLQLTYDANGKHAGDIVPGNLILATPSDGANPQPFRIYETSKNLDGTINANANHISYDLGGYFARNITGITTAAGAIEALTSRAWLPTGFTITTDLSVTKNWEKRGAFSIRSAMGGDGSILETYGGEWKYDGYNVQLLQARGQDNGVTIRYRKNLTGLEAVTNDENDYTGTFSYWLSGGTYVSSTDITYVSTAAQSAVPQKILIVDHTSDFQSEPTKAQLDALAASDLANVGIIKSLTVSFVPLWRSSEYKDLAPIERVQMGDIVGVIYDRFNVNVKLEVVQTDYNVLLDKYNSIELGALRPSLADTIINLSK